MKIPPEHVSVWEERKKELHTTALNDHLFHSESIVLIKVVIESRERDGCGRDFR